MSKHLLATIVSRQPPRTRWTMSSGGQTRSFNTAAEMFAWSDLQMKERQERMQQLKQYL